MKLNAMFRDPGLAVRLVESEEDHAKTRRGKDAKKKGKQKKHAKGHCKPCGHIRSHAAGKRRVKKRLEVPCTTELSVCGVS